MFEQVRQAVRAAFMAKNRTSGDLEGELEREQEVLSALEADVADAEQGFASAAVDGNDITSARAHKRLQEARVKADTSRERVRVLELTADGLRHREYEAREAAKWAAAEERLRERDKAASELDEAARNFSRCFVAMIQANARAFEALPKLPVSTPALFNPQSLRIVVEMMLYGLTDRRWLPRHGAGLETPHTAKQLPTVGQRARAERELLFAGHRQHETPGPEAA